MFFKRGATKNSNLVPIITVVAIIVVVVGLFLFTGVEKGNIVGQGFMDYVAPSISGQPAPGGDPCTMECQAIYDACAAHCAAGGSSGVGVGSSSSDGSITGQGIGGISTEDGVVYPIIDDPCLRNCQYLLNTCAANCQHTDVD